MLDLPSLILRQLWSYDSKIYMYFKRADYHCLAKREKIAKGFGNLLTKLQLTF